MKDTTIAEVSDAAVITDPEEIRLLSNDPSIDRDFTGPTTIRNQTFLKTMLQIFSVGGNPLPTMLPRTDASRAAEQDALWSKLNLLANDLKSGPQEMRSARLFSSVWAGCLSRTLPAPRKAGQRHA
jgi:hypothetical protein